MRSCNYAVEADEAGRLAAVAAAAGRLHADRVTVEAVLALRDRGIDCLLLKGPGIARWLFSTMDARSYSDSDLMVAPDRFSAAVDTLRRLGFQPELEESRMPAWWRAHALALIRRIDRSVVDMHRTLPGVGVDDATCWELLLRGREAVTLGHTRVWIPGKPARLVHCALHTAQHGGEWRDIQALERALELAGEDTWREAARLAAELRCRPQFRVGLEYLPAGLALAERLGLERSGAIRPRLMARGTAPALTLLDIATAHGLARRAAMVARKLAPPRTFMLAWSPLARRGKIGLAAAYAWRPVWVATQLPRALRAIAEERARRRQ